MAVQGADSIDILALARTTALTDSLMSRPGMCKVIAPAKVNLFLSVGDVQSTGLHNVENILHTVMLHDVVFIRSIPTESESETKPAISVTCVGHSGVEAPDITAEDNIVYRAVEQLAQALGRTQFETIEIIIEKHIPHQAGLGGGSSDAAATLVGLAQLWNLSLDNPALQRIACSLGSDVSFFLHGGCALFAGAGERFVQTFEPRRESLVIIKPACGLSTRDVYAEYDRVPCSATNSTLEAALASGVARDVELNNNLSDAAERLLPELASIRTWLLDQTGVRSALLCGSGSASFAITDTFAEASIIAAHAQARGWWARATSFANIRAMSVPAE